MKKTLLVVLIVVVIALLYGWSTYNGFVTKQESIDNQWAQVQTQYQRRFDLIPNLVRSVDKIMGQEKTVFDALAEARTRYSGAKTIEDKVNAANQVESSLGRLLAVVENYPELKSAGNVQTLMVQLEGTENRISVERQRYNDTVKDLNVAVKRFPSNVIAALFGVKARTYFESQKGAENAPIVR